MKKYSTQILILVIILLPLAFSINAYNNPTSGEQRPGNTSVEPIYTDSSVQIKNGNLDVGGAFTATGNNAGKVSAYFDQDVFIPGFYTKIIGNGSTASSTVTVGSDLSISGSLITNHPYIGHSWSVQSDTLKHDPTSFSLKEVCALADGTFVLCQ
jgi:hypothetical protein